MRLPASSHESPVRVIFVPHRAPIGPMNPGSVGMPLDGDVRAAWAVWDGSDFAFRRTEYDLDRAAAGWRRLGGDFGNFAAERVERGRD